MKKVAIVEDDSRALAIYEQALRSAGFDVLPYSDGKNVVIELKNYKPDLILLDIMLPGGVNGFDIAEQLKRDAATSHIPIIILSNLDSEKNVAVDIGVNEYLVKAETSLEQIVAIAKKYLG